MNLKQAEIILEKITRLYKSMKLDERNIDAFEQDLMLSYIRQLYESFSPDKPVTKKVKPILPPVEPSPVKPVVKEAPKPSEPLKPKPKPVEPKVVEKTPEPQLPKVSEAPKVVPPPTSPTKPVSPAPKPVSKPKPSPPPSRPSVSNAKNGLSVAERAALFEFKEATELSEKLSMSPIRDLTKAMGLNEKIFTINELFGGDSKSFAETIQTLNTFTSFEQAAEYLANGVAFQQKWTNKNKKKKAINFITLVKRRYS